MIKRSSRISTLSTVCCFFFVATSLYSQNEGDAAKDNVLVDTSSVVLQEKDSVDLAGGEKPDSLNSKTIVSRDQKDPQVIEESSKDFETQMRAIYQQSKAEKQERLLDDIKKEIERSYQLDGSGLSQTKYLSLLSTSMAFVGDRFLRDAVIPYKEPEDKDVLGEFGKEIDVVKIINSNIKAFQSYHEQELLRLFAEQYNTKIKLRNTRIILLDRVGRNRQKDVFSIEFEQAASAYKEKDLFTARLYFDDIFKSYQNIVPQEMENVLFLSAESSFGLRIFLDARRKYNFLISNYPSSRHYQTSIYRLILMDYIVDDEEQLMSDYKMLGSEMVLNKAWNSISSITNSIRAELSNIKVEKQLANVNLQQAELMLVNPRLREDRKVEVRQDVEKISNRIQDLDKKIKELSQTEYNLKIQTLDSLRKVVPKKILEYNAKVLIMKSIFLFQRGRYFKALDDLRKVPDYLEVSNLARYVEAMCHAKVGNLAEANLGLEKVLSLKTKNRRNVIDYDLIDRAKVQLAKIYYDQGDAILKKAREVYGYDDTRLGVVDSIGIDGVREKDLVRFARGIERNLVSNFFLAQKNKLSLDSLSMKVANEGTLLSDVNVMVQRTAYEVAVSRDKKKKEEVSQLLENILDETLKVRRALGDIAEKLNENDTELRLAEKNVRVAKEQLRKRIAGVKYKLADQSFQDIKEYHADKSISEIGNIWSLIKQNRYIEAINKSKEFKKNWRESDKIYQAILAEAYILQKRYPANIQDLIDIYRFIWDGETTFLYVKQFIQYKIQLLERKYYFENLIRRISNKEAIEKFQFASDKIDEALAIIAFDRKNITSLEVGQLLSEDEKKRLQEVKASIELIRNDWQQGGKILKASESVLGQVDKIMTLVLGIGDEKRFRNVKYFLKHAPAILQAELDEYEKELEVHKGNMEREVMEYQRRLNLISKKVEPRSKEEKFLYQYLLSSIESSRNRAFAMGVLLKQRQFFATDGISRFAKESRYGFVASVYDYIRKLSTMMKGNRRKIDNIKSAIKKKISQLRINADGIDKYIDRKRSEGFRVDVALQDDDQDIEKEFSDIMSDFGKAYFVGTQHLVIKNRKNKLKKYFP